MITKISKITYYVLSMNDFDSEAVFQKSVHQFIISFSYFAIKSLEQDYNMQTLGFYTILTSLFHYQIDKESVSVKIFCI